MLSRAWRRSDERGSATSRTNLPAGQIHVRPRADRRIDRKHLCTNTGRRTARFSHRTSFGRLDPSRLSRFDANGRQIEGDKPTKEMPLHTAFYDTRSTAGAVVHLHSCHSVAWSLMPEVDEDNFLPPLTPYAIMKLGKVKLLPFFMPGDPAMGEAVRGLAGKRSAVMLANHGPVVAGKDVEAACNAIEELEDTARLAILMRGHEARRLTDDQIRALVTKFDVEWDT